MMQGQVEPGGTRENKWNHINVEHCCNEIFVTGIFI